MSALKLLVADDHPLYREALTGVIRGQWPDAEITEAATFGATLAAVEADPDLDLILLDLHMPGSDGLDGLMTLRSKAPTIPVAMVSAEEDREIIRRALTCGGSGFIVKSAGKDRIVEAIRRILDGGVSLPPDLAAALERETARSPDDLTDSRRKTLTPAEMGVFHLLIQGKPNKIIAYELDIKESTVKAHISAILRKMGVHSRTQAVLAARNRL
ncbi:MAG: response regulator transcription factor [Rhodospirillum sp.]|nr:response regulator transcription factor [Rhodospirillum sp.]MCF8488558.1 response regulator transcription factor [Rhodospirillum sp.]MCF8499154.1 response regulator transcription factor [Rhodospirillum sp.]